MPRPEPVTIAILASSVPIGRGGYRGLLTRASGTTIAGMGEAVIVSAVRTPIADAYKGSLANTSIYDIGKASVVEALEAVGHTRPTRSTT